MYPHSLPGILPQSLIHLSSNARLMQCIWSTTAKTALRDSSRKRLSVLAWSRARTLWSPPRTCEIIRWAHTATSPVYDINDRSADATSSSRNFPTVQLFEADAGLSSMTAAQISRAAAQAVRVSPPQDALYILNSLFYSTLTPGEKESVHDIEEVYRTTPRSPLDVHVPFKPIDFGQPVSPRLASHSFLHALLRRGQPSQAAQLAESLMKQGHRVQPSTLEATVKALCESDKSFWDRRRASTLPRSLHSRHVLDISNDSFSHPGNAIASLILIHARKYGQERSERMYETLVRACLLHGEIVVAALLFALLVKDWQVNSARKLAEAEAASRANAVVTEESSDTTVYGRRARYGLDVDALLRRTAKHRNIPWTSFEHAPYPTAGLLKQITDRIEVIFLEEADSVGGGEHLQEPLQALTILAMLIEEGDIHFGKLSPLIRTLYKTPKTEHRVWKRQHGKPVQINAYRYFHGVLSRMIKSLKDPTRMKLPPLDTRACNSLLQYALRHRLSPALASNVLEHMVVHRDLAPDPITLNVLLRSGTVLRREDISDTALRILRRLNQHDTSALVNLEPCVIFRGNRRQRTATRSSFGHAMIRLREENITFPEKMLDSRSSMQADEVTVVSYITHLTSTGQPDVIPNVLFLILPELATVDHPSWGQLSLEERDITLDSTREESVKRGVALGPLFFTVVLNALTKTGKTGLAERVWLFAKTAERASWIDGFLPGTEPWCLPVSAYTSIMQCYANEGRKGLPIRKVTEDGRVIWVPRSNNHVRGWARLVYQTQRREGGESRNWKRFRAARTMARILLRAMLSGISAVARSLLHIEQTVRAANAKITTTLPKPDARFFNAALKLFHPLPGMLPRRMRTTRSRLRRFLRWAHAVYGQHGRKAEHWDILLQDIAEAMINAGYPVPPAFRHLFIGRYSPGMASFRPPVTLIRSPFSYPRPRYRFRPHALPTSKTRGLPVRHSLPRLCRQDARDQSAPDTSVSPSP
ncbi:uncharacterized protein PHACADRAFT_205765 [Phanerochaete carnosa HHB-10118-sp]|uniref:Uncharacterized protein n=1 Tax=Phanerochaete carnosa (strain HHB-10118-sp) TaxID=650164 RepID=K5V9M9_PHACS|nr:uncharacterized protein PHACADRAFT_205765 [Phanerochaete carnosa HHB-10118-sp]EKM59546.1 hypothetical protein PHACADRAFT_205765 [Phanerochaete carnosa HHB-10118-sp]